jgi:uncharacterized protein (DUF58 family)
MGILVTLVTFYIAFIYASATIGLLAFSEAVLVVLAFLYLCIYREKIEVDMRVPIMVADPGGKVTMVIKTSNRGHFSCTKVRYRIRSGHAFLRKTHGNWMNGETIYPGKNTYQNVISPQIAGNYTFELVKIRLYDMTGLFFMDRKMRQSTQVQILPEIGEVRVRISERTRNFYGDADVYDDFRPGEDKSEIFDVREFREGDRIQSIHWKLSAKTDELLVRQDSHPLACPLVFLLENPQVKRTGQLKNTQYHLSVVASIVYSLMDISCPHFIAWYSDSLQDIVRARVDDEESYYIFLTEYMQDCAGKSYISPEEMYHEKYRFDHAIFTLKLDESGKLMLNGDLLTQIDRRNWKESLKGIELVL